MFASIYAGLDVLLAGDNLMYSYGLLYHAQEKEKKIKLQLAREEGNMWPQIRHAGEGKNVMVPGSGGGKHVDT
jgi:hypothetical protein